MVRWVRGLIRYARALYGTLGERKCNKTTALQDRSLIATTDLLQAELQQRTLQIKDQIS